MKKSMKICAALLLMGAASCTDLDVPIESEYTPGNFPTTPESFVAATGPIYTQLRSRYAVDYWRLQEHSTDAAIIPARGGNYDDGGRFRTLHYHTWNPDHIIVKDVWEWGFGGINTCNRILNLFESAPESETKAMTVAEVRTMKALFYFFMMDLFGNIPIIRAFGETDAPATAPRVEVFAYIEEELKAALPDLSTTVGQLTYGRPTKFAAYALLQKLYLNAEYYTGTPRYVESVEMGDHILAKGRYSLDADYMSIFAPDNGAQIQETILAVPYDANVAEGNHFNRYGLHTAIQEKYELPFRPSIALSTIADYYALFNLEGDVRNDTWLAGKQYNWDGTPITISTTKKGLDETYEGADGTAPIEWHLEFTPEMPLRFPATMDIGNDVLGQARGVRSIKYYPDKNANPSTRYQNNDMPVFRLADVYLMKAEAILRGAAATAVNGELQTPALLVNKIRERAHAPLVESVSLGELLDERARELAWEGWRRNDLIRFGRFEDSWGYKTDSNPNMRLYPVPTSERTLNPNLDQNTGYQ